MNTNCPRCNAVLASDSRFCTNCGTVLATAGPQQSQVPPWASANPNAGYYQPSQQSWGGDGASPMESLGFASQNASIGQSLDNDALLKKAILAIIVVIAVALASLVLFGLLALFVPGLRCVFLIAVVLAFMVPWIIYVNIRNRIRRTIGTIGRIGWFF